MDSVFRALILPVTVFIIVILFGTIGYMHLNQIPFIDALQLVVVTLTTCGLRQAGQTTFLSKLFDIIFILVGFTVIIAIVSKAFSLVLEGQIKGIQAREKMRKTLQKIKDHFIICGFGRVGKQVVAQLIENKVPVVVIDSKPEAEEVLKSMGLPYVLGSLSSDEVLKKAQIETAKGLVACADSDVENVFGTLSARTINPKLTIIARASDPSNESKLKRAGANYVISPYQTTGQKIASMILNPSVVNFLDRVMHDQNLAVWFQEAKLPKGSKLAGKSIKDVDFRKKVGIIILGLRHASGAFDASPQADTVLKEEDTLIALGTNEQLAALKNLF